MSDAAPSTTLNYSTSPSNPRLTVQASDDGVTVYDGPPGTLQVLGVTMMMVIALGLPLLIVFSMRFSARFFEGNQFRLIVLLIALVIVTIVCLRSLWKRRGVRTLIRVQGDRLIIVTPDRFRVSREWPLANVRSIAVAASPLTSGRRGALHVKLARRRRIMLFEGCSVAELEDARRELLSYLPHLHAA
jgi:hypothetical protein